MRVAHLHYLVLDGNTLYLDVWICLLSLQSRGKYLLAGDVARTARDQLAGALAEGLLAELLISERPIRVTSCVNGYVIEEVELPKHKETARECSR